MLGRTTDTPICTFREHSWVVRLAALGVTAMLVRALVASTGGSSSGPWWLKVLLIALGLLIPVALLAWDRQRGVHVLANGIRSVGANGSRFLPWGDVARFEIDSYIAGTIAVFAVRQDGRRIGLSDTARWRYKRRTVEEMRDRLSGYRERWLTTTR